MNTVDQVLKHIKESANPAALAGIARFAVPTENRFGLSVPQMRKIAKEIGLDHRLALALWKSGYPEARIIAAMIADPVRMTERDMDRWVKDLNSWDICDCCASILFEKTPFAWKKIDEWSERGEEFVKRAAFAMIASLAWHDKEAEDGVFVDALKLIERESTDERNFVKKAVNWALRNIGKRNRRLNRIALKSARAIRQIDSKSARWIASDAIRELESEAVQKRLR